MQFTTEEELKARLDAGKLLETPDQMSEDYMMGLKRILTVSADTELLSAPAYYHAATKAPSINAFVSAMAIIQDELGHANIAYRLLEDLGFDKEDLIYERQPAEFKYPYAFDVPLDTWVELICANALYDRAGYVLLGDIYKHTTFAPWKRALVKVDREENFHLRHGETWIRKICESEAGRREVQRAIDWMFPMVMEWFGLPDDKKRHTEQLSYGIKGSSNDTLRQVWLSSGVPFCESAGLKLPVHWVPASSSERGESRGHYELDYPFPCEFDPAEKRWLMAEGEISWGQVLNRWKARGPKNEEYIEKIQRGHKELRKMMGVALMESYTDESTK
ncbi:MAG: phenylacetate-CoA oxygenase subunit PaaI [Anaerolineae bacterium]|nr:phenylacetate-CoA oxygenase subunit PaaI [Anaerolineae bacterium]